MHKIFFSITILSFLLFSPSRAQNKVNIIPVPVKMELTADSFVIDETTSIDYDKNDTNLKELANFLETYIQEISGIELLQNTKAQKRIHFSLIKDNVLGTEGYRLHVNHQAITIQANTHHGIFYGLQSLFQTLPPIRTNALLKVPGLDIEDYPRFKWRGMMLDVSRHFFSPETIKQFIDLLATYKFNVFHWHLTDDPGWRIEIKKYPKLTKVGAWRVDHLDKLWDERPPAKPGEEATYGGFYTQQQIREIVAYAEKRNITIVPEIEMPSHSVAALAAYPQLSCTEQPQFVNTGGIYPKNVQSVYCLGKEEVYTFLENVLKEVLELFPSQYIHVGGDEVNKSQWEQCPRCQQRIKEEGLRNEDELQGYLMKRISMFLSQHGRKLIGWDEILDGGLSSDAAVMSWRGEAGGIKAAKMKHEVVMAPGSPCYFDHYQSGPEGEPVAMGGINTLKNVYEYEPIPPSLTQEEAHYILGAQANVWAEYISSVNKLEYMILPRMLALSEVVWSPTGKRDWVDFNLRLRDRHFRTFDQKGFVYHEGNSKVNITPIAKNGRLLVSLSTERIDGEIIYTLDGSEPTLKSNKYKEPLVIASSCVLKAYTVVNGKILGIVPASQQFTIHKAIGREVNYKYPVSPYYMADGPNSLTDGIRGTLNVQKFWHGFNGSDMVATIDLEKEMEISKLTLGVLQKRKDWIFPARYVEFEVSENGKDFISVAKINCPIEKTDVEDQILEYTVKLNNVTARYLRVSARNFGVCPKGHPGEGKPSWLFVDEIIVE